MLQQEIKRKIFHHLALAYLLIYWMVPRWFSLWLLGAILFGLGAIEFLRLRRPELNAWFLKKFRNIHRPTEVMAPSGIFWTLLGCWLTIFVFTNKNIVLPALGFLVFGDTAAALCGEKWGRHFWKGNPAKTYEGSAGFWIVSAVWASFFVRPHVAVMAAAVGAWLETRRLPWNDNVWIPLLSGLALSVFNLLVGRR